MSSLDFELVHGINGIEQEEEEHRQQVHSTREYEVCWRIAPYSNEQI